MSRNVEIKNICCIGAGYVGGPTMAVIADKCPHINIVLVDKNIDRLNAWRQDDLDKLPIYEPGLKEIIQRVRYKNLHFSNEVEHNIKKAEMIFISVNTPIKTSGVGAGQASNLFWVEKCARQIGKYANGYKIVVEKSTLPVKTAKMIQKILDESSNTQDKKNYKKKFSVLSNPEFLSEGNSIKDLTNPDRVLIGGEYGDEIAINSLREIYLNWVKKEKIILTNLWSSELSKLTANAFLAQRVSSINSISALCEVTGADVNQVAKAVGADSRIGDKFLNAGPGFGGSCFKKDILNLVYLSKYYGLDEVAKYWETIIELNSWQKERIYKTIVEKLFGNIQKKRIVILGFSFKADTNDTRESPAISICYSLMQEGADLVINDPKVNKLQIEDELNNYHKIQSSNKSKIKGTWKFELDIYKAVVNADALVILTEWQQYSLLDLQKISNLMRSPAWIFDTRSILDNISVKEFGINYWSLGKGAP